MVLAVREGPGEPFAEVEVTGGGVGFFGDGGADVEDVGGDVLLGGDAGEGDVEAAVGDVLGDEVKESEAIRGADFHDGAAYGDVPVHVHVRGDGGAETVLEGEGGFGF